MYLSREKKLPIQIMKTGRWWGSDPKRCREEEIDLVGLNLSSKKALVGECKFRKEKTGMETVELLIERGELFAGGFQKSYIIFSRSGFTPEVEQVSKDRGILLVTLEEMY